MDDGPVSVALEEGQIFAEFYARQAGGEFDGGGVAVLVYAVDLEVRRVLCRARVSRVDLVDEIFKRKPIRGAFVISDDGGTWVKDLAQEARIGISHCLHIVCDCLSDCFRHGGAFRQSYE